MKTRCCIVGGGPAGMMLGYLLARAGVQVTVLEKHKDFFRDFRGDTVHPSTLDVFGELGLLEEFLRIPHQTLSSVGAVFGDYSFEAADFSHLPTRCKYIALMPQWDLLNFLSSQARKFPSFDLRMEHEAVDLVEDGAQVRGVVARTPDGNVQIEADLVIGCDGRHSLTRKAAGFEVREFGVPIDVLWFHISRDSKDPERSLGNVNYGQALILINRNDYYQAGLIIRKDSFEDIKKRGLEEFRKQLLRIAPYLGERVDEVDSWDQVKLLSVQINRLRKWHRPGLLCIGDAAHAMSPAGGVGINLAVQDAVATANLLSVALLQGDVPDELLARVQQRREFPVRVTQFVQVQAHKGFQKVFENTGPLQAPWQMKVVTSAPGVQKLLGRLVGMGARPEHVGQTYSNVSPRAKGAALAVGMAVGLSVFAALTRRGTVLQQPAQ